jgi:excisionase family DNA binding protein
MSLDEVARYLKLNRHTAYRLVKAGKLPAFKVGAQWRFDVEDVKAWLEANSNCGKEYNPEFDSVD